MSTQQRRGLGRGLRPIDPDWPGAWPGRRGDAEPRPTGSAAGLDRPAAPPAGPAGAGRLSTPGRPTSPDARPDRRSRRPSGERREPAEPVTGAYFAELPSTGIVPNPRQPRQVFEEDALAELVHSIREVGLLQPVVVRPRRRGRYELVMGERRLARGHRRPGSTAIPAIVRETDDDRLLRDALLENLHRAQLNPLEEAAAYQQLLEDFGCTHEELAGAHRPQPAPDQQHAAAAQALRPVQRRVAAGVLSRRPRPRAAGRRRRATRRTGWPQRVVAEGISVRGLEELVAVGELGEDEAERPRAGASRRPPRRCVELADRLSDLYDTRVKVDLGRTKGRIAIEFATLEDLERIVRSMDPSSSAASPASADRTDGSTSSRRQRRALSTKHAERSVDLALAIDESIARRQGDDRSATCAARGVAHRSVRDRDLGAGVRRQPARLATPSPRHEPRVA